MKIGESKIPARRLSIGIVIQQGDCWFFKNNVRAIVAGRKR